ncbi:MAG: four helix bundle protein [Patescibacteria group bacterium]
MGIKHFSELDAWKKGHTLVLLVYEYTKNFPDDERFGLVNQMRRAAVSITSNIAEGFGRTTINDKVHFYTMAKTSLSEIENQMLIAKDLDYVATNIYEQFKTLVDEEHRLLGGLMKSARSKTH